MGCRGFFFLFSLDGLPDGPSSVGVENLINVSVFYSGFLFLLC